MWEAFFYLNVAYVSHICCKSMFEMFHLFQSYVTISVFMLHVGSILSGCCIVSHVCCKYMFQMFHLLQTMLHSSVSCCKCFMFQRYVQSDPGTRGRGAASRGPADEARGVPRVLQTGLARPHPHPGS
jgi:hypothetical protein